jgi:hypothetical protein
MKKVLLNYLLTVSAAFIPMVAYGQNRMGNSLVYPVPLATENPLRKQIFSDITIPSHFSFGQGKTCRCALSRRYPSSKEDLFLQERTFLLRTPESLTLVERKKLIGKKVALGGPGTTFGVWSAGGGKTISFIEEKDPHSHYPFGNIKRVSSITPWATRFPISRHYKSYSFLLG